MFVLGLESSCDETSVAVIEADRDSGKMKICSNIVASQIDIHKLYGGVVPEIASRAHIEAISEITEQALDCAGVKIGDIGAVAVTTHPGLIGALLVGVNFAKALSFANKIPLVPVNHIKAHVSAAYLSYEDLKPPFLALVVSGGHTSFYDVVDYNTFNEIGSTRDDAVGEAFDKIGRVIGMPYPSGAALDALAGTGNPNSIKLPSPALVGDNLDFSFSGIKTATLNYINSEKQKESELCTADIAASYTSAIVSAISKKAEMALNRVMRGDFVIAGGVAANSHLRLALGEICERRGVRFMPVPLSLCGDNAAMVACSGYFEYLDNNIASTDLNASAAD